VRRSATVTSPLQASPRTLTPIRISSSASASLSCDSPIPACCHIHDLHHVATGYDSSLLGEAEISVFELRNGAGTPLIFFLCCGSILVGLCLSPQRMWRAWRAARGAHSLYGTQIPYETLLAMDVSALRKTMALESQMNNHLSQSRPLSPFGIEVTASAASSNVEQVGRRN